MAGQEKPKPQELEKWYFVKEQLQNSPSRKCGLDADKELAYRQQSANLIQDMGQRLQVSQLCINTAIVYMHRFYAFHSFTQFHRNAIAAAALFLAAKVEEQPRKLEYVIKVAHACLHRGDSLSSITNEHYQEQAQDLVFNENVLLQTLGFDVAIDHPHTHVVRTCHLVKAPKDLAQTSYFMASNSLHLTTMCLQYRPTVVACFCIHLASKWSNWAIPQSCEGRHWFSYVDNTVTSELLERLTAEFLHIFDKCPSRLKKKMKTMSGNSVSSPHSGVPHSSSQAQPVATTPFDKKHATDDFDKTFDREYEREKRRQPMPGGYVPAAVPAASAIPTPQKIDYNLYKEKREREERERRQQQARAGVPPRPGQPPQPHQRPASHHNKQPHHQWPHHAKPHHKPHDKVPHEKMPHDKVSHDKIPHDKIPHDKIQHEKIPHEKIPHDKIPHDHRHLRQQIPSTSSNSNPFQNPQPEVVQRTRPPSLFSPENVTTPSVAAAAPRRIPQKPPRPEQRPMPPSHPVQIPNSMHERQERPISPHKKRPDNASAVIKEMQQPMILSPFSSPPAVKEQPQRLPRQRLQSNSEPELVPVVKKLDETPGYENVIRDSQRGNIIKTRPLEPKREPPPRALNGIETDPTLVSNLLKESLAKPAPITVVTEKRSPLEREIKREPIPEIVPIPIPAQIEPGPIAPPPSTSEETSEHKHKKEKKKKEKHKHKDRDKSKEERKKHKKDKERDKKKEPTPQAPVEQQPAIDNLKITIPRDKLSNSPGGQGLKIKIPKERLAVPPPPPQQSGLKIKISKDILDSTRKRAAMPEPGPPQKMARQNGAHHSKMEAHLGNGHGK